MPIRPELKVFYGPAWYAETRPAILERAGRKCEHCAKPDRALILTVTGRRLLLPIQFGARARFEPVMFWRPAPVIELPRTPRQPAAAIAWRNHRGQIDTSLWTNGALALGPIRRRVAQIGVAHLNNVAGDDRPENLRALCNWCHLIHDADYHRQTRQRRKDAGRELFKLIEQPAPQIRKAAPDQSSGPIPLHLPTEVGGVLLISV